MLVDTIDLVCGGGINENVMILIMESVVIGV